MINCEDAEKKEEVTQEQCKHYYGRDQNAKEHISLKSLYFLSTVSIYFIVEIKKRKFWNRKVIPFFKMISAFGFRKCDLNM